MNVFKAIRRRWRIWKVRVELRRLNREASELGERIKKNRAQKKGVKRLLRQRIETVNQRIRIERRARIY